MPSPPYPFARVLAHVPLRLYPCFCFHASVLLFLCPCLYGFTSTLFLYGLICPIPLLPILLPLYPCLCDLSLSILAYVPLPMQPCPFSLVSVPLQMHPYPCPVPSTPYPCRSALSHTPLTLCPCPIAHAPKHLPPWPCPMCPYPSTPCSLFPVHLPS